MTEFGILLAISSLIFRFEKQPPCESLQAQDVESVSSNDPQTVARGEINTSTPTNFLLIERWTHIEVTLDQDGDGLGKNRVSLAHLNPGILFCSFCNCV